MPFMMYFHVFAAGLLSTSAVGMGMVRQEALPHHVVVNANGGMHRGQRTNKDLPQDSTKRHLGHESRGSLLRARTGVHPPSIEPQILLHPQRGTYSQYKQDLILTPIIERIGHGFFVESGAKDGESSSNTLLYELNHGWTGLLIEPDPKAFAVLKGKRRHAYSYNGALSPHGRQETLRYHADAVSKTGSEHGKGHIDGYMSEGGSADIGMLNVKAQPLHVLMAAVNRTTVDFWSLDVEGCEADVLRSTDFSKVEVGVLLIEMNKDDANTAGIHEVMRREGFEDIGQTFGPVKALDHIFVNPKYFRKRNMKVPTGGELPLRKWYPERSEAKHATATQVKSGTPSSVDLVYLYINGSEPGFKRLRKESWTTLRSTGNHTDMTVPSMDGQQANDMSLTKDGGELLFSLRSMMKFFNGKIRKVFLVTETPPVWLNTAMLASGELEVVHPGVIMPLGSYPNFNSRALESNLHKIPGLGDYYMTLNDDVYLGSLIGFSDLLSEGVLKIHMAWHPKYSIEADDDTNEKLKDWNSHHSSMKNANRLLDRHFGHRKNRKKVSHSPLFWSKALVQDAHSIFREALDNTTSHIFRSHLDVHPGFLYSHYMLENKSIMAEIEDSHEEMVVFPKIKHVTLFCKMVSSGVQSLPRYFSVNNHMSPAEEQHMKGWIRAGLHALFPVPSKYEDVRRHELDKPPPGNFCKLPDPVDPGNEGGH